MKRSWLTFVLVFAAGCATGAMVVWPLAVIVTSLPDDSQPRIVRIIQGPDGKLKEARLSFPTWAELYRTVEDVSGLKITLSEVPEGGATWSVKDLPWDKALVMLPPPGFTVQRISDAEFRVDRER